MSPRKRLRDGPTRIGYRLCVRPSRFPNKARLCSEVFPKPIPGSRQMRSANASFGGPRRRHHQLVVNVVDHVVVSRLVLHRPGRALHVHDHHPGRRFDAHLGHSRFPQPVDVIDDLSPRLDGGGGDAGFEVSIETTTPSATRAGNDGQDPPRSSASSTESSGGSIHHRRRRCLRRLRQGSRPWRMAASATREGAPSENESGVTLTTPMISVWSSLERLRVRSRHIRG